MKADVDVSVFTRINLLQFISNDTQSVENEIYIMIHEGLLQKRFRFNPVNVLFCIKEDLKKYT